MHSLSGPQGFSESYWQSHIWKKKKYRINPSFQKTTTTIGYLRITSIFSIDLDISDRFVGLDFDVGRWLQASLEAQFAHVKVLSSLFGLVIGGVKLSSFDHGPFERVLQGFGSQVSVRVNIFSIVILKQETTAVTNPVVLFGATKLDRKLSHLVWYLVNVVWHFSRMKDLRDQRVDFQAVQAMFVVCKESHPSRPPTKMTEFDPHNLIVDRHPTTFAVGTVEGALGRLHLEAIGVKAGGTELTTDECSTFGTQKAPLNIDMTCRFLGRSSCIMLGTDDQISSDLQQEDHVIAKTSSFNSLLPEQYQQPRSSLPNGKW